MKTIMQHTMLSKAAGLVFAVSIVGAVFMSGILSVHADVAPVITSSLRNGTETIVSSALIGTSIHNVVTVASSTGATPTGTVEFNVYPNTTCSGAAVTQSGVALVNGVATSSVSILGANGISYKVHYNGDVNNVATDENCKAVTATSNTSVISTTLSSTTPVLVGTSVNDSAVLTGVTANAGGTVAFVIYTDAACSVAFSGAGVKTVVSGVVPNSDLIQFNTPGVYRWQAVYSGDANNSAATSTCSNEILTVNAVGKTNTSIATTLSTTTSVVAGSVVHDSAVLSGMTADASGTVAYTVYTDTACTVPLQGAGVVNVTNGVVPNSQDVAINTPGTYYWRAAYSGDAKNNASVNVCASEVLTVIANPVATAHLIVDKVTVPSGDPTGFMFTTTGTGYVAFNLTDAATPNNQTLLPGTYAVAESAIAGWTQTSAVCSKNGAATTTYSQGSSITLAANDSVTCVFTNTKNVVQTGATLAGTVYNDANKSGAKDAGEVGISGFTINLYQGAGWTGSPMKSVVTDASGGYSFSGLANGTYSVEEINQPLWKQFTSDFNSIIVTGGVSQSGLDIANVAIASSTSGCAKHHDDEDDDGDDDHNCSDHVKHGKDKNRGEHIFTFENHDNGLHLGWTKGKGNQNSDKHGFSGKNKGRKDD